MLTDLLKNEWAAAHQERLSNKIAVHLVDRASRIPTLLGTSLRKSECSDNNTLISSIISSPLIQYHFLKHHFALFLEATVVLIPLIRPTSILVLFSQPEKSLAILCNTHLLCFAARSPSSACCLVDDNNTQMIQRHKQKRHIS